VKIILIQLAQEKDEELSEVVSRLRAYERGHYGLEEAVEDANNSRKQNKLKDKQIEQLMHEANNLQVFHSLFCNPYFLNWEHDVSP